VNDPQLISCRRINNGHVPIYTTTPARLYWLVIFFAFTGCFLIFFFFRKPGCFTGASTKASDEKAPATLDTRLVPAASKKKKQKSHQVTISPFQLLMSSALASPLLLLRHPANSFPLRSPYIHSSPREKPTFSASYSFSPRRERPTVETMPAEPRRTGCCSTITATKSAAGRILYLVVGPFWSDHGGDKNAPLNQRTASDFRAGPLFW